MKKKCKYR